MRRVVLMVVLLAVAGAAAGVLWWLTHRHKTAQELTLYGNVDLRQVELAFNNSERIAEVAAQRQIVERLRHGSRPEEIAQARANLESAKADAVNARRQYERLKPLLG